jgi:hypothetical protein
MKAPEPLPPQEAIQRQREKDRFAPLNAILDQLEPGSSLHISMASDRINLSIALSLKRIADALEPTITGVSHLEGDVNALVDGLKELSEAESLAGDMLNLTLDEVEKKGSIEVLHIIKRLSSAVLRKANK